MESPTIILPHRRLFHPGKLYATQGVAAIFQNRRDIPFIGDLIARHVTGDWGDLDDFDKAQNDAAVEDGGRIFSAYRIANDLRVWVITEADRSSTTVLFPSEY